MPLTEKRSTWLSWFSRENMLGIRWAEFKLFSMFVLFILNRPSQLLSKNLNQSSFHESQSHRKASKKVYSILLRINYLLLMWLQDSVQLKDLWKKICHHSSGMEFQDHRYWLRTHPNCIVGKELVNWLIRNGHIATRYYDLKKEILKLFINFLKQWYIFEGVRVTHFFMS